MAAQDQHGRAYLMPADITPNLIVTVDGSFGGFPAFSQVKIKTDQFGELYLPNGEGLLAFTSPDEALAGIDAINANYPAHAARAREIAAEHFAAPRVLARLLDVCSR